MAISSQPSFDPNHMAENWEKWRIDPQAPLLNRVTQGVYPPGAILGPFLYAWAKPESNGMAGTPTYSLNGNRLECALSPEAPSSWENLVGSGCPGALVELGDRLSISQIQELLDDYGFYSAPDFELPTAPPTLAEPLTDEVLASLGQSGIKVSPLQVALAAAQLSNGGIRPSPRLSSAVHTPHQGWVILPAGSGVTSNQISANPEGLTAGSANGLPIWDAVGKALTDDSKPLTWYISATINSWPGSPLALALVLEEDNPDLAVEIGRALIYAALNPP
jgi:hypothetical protein